MIVKNAKELPKVYFGLHFCEGVAEYKEGYRIFLNENTIKKMDATFKGRPVYVQHVDEVNLDKLQVEADGYVIKSFYNAVDGKHWAEFIVVSDKGHEAIRNGWKLSNAYVPTSMGQGGLWHGVEYAKEVLDGEFEHLAIVNNPRYEESIILTPTEFKEYNLTKETELMKIANSKGEKSMFNFFKKSKVENGMEYEDVSVVLPKSKVEKTIKQLVEEMDTIQNMHGYANGDHLVKVGEDEMSVNDLVKKHMEMCNAAKEMEEKKNEEKPKEEAKNAEEPKKEEMKKENDEEKMEDSKEEEKKEESVKSSADADNFKKLKNAETEKLNVIKFELTEDKVTRGKARYGSSK